MCEMRVGVVAREGGRVRRAGDPYLLVQVYGSVRSVTVRVGRSHGWIRPRVMRTHGGWIGYGGRVYVTARRVELETEEAREDVPGSSS